MQAFTDLFLDSSPTPPERVPAHKLVTHTHWENCDDTSIETGTGDLGTRDGRRGRLRAGRARGALRLRTAALLRAGRNARVLRARLPPRPPPRLPRAALGPERALHAGAGR